MRKQLGRKAVNTEQEWLETAKNIESIVSLGEIRHTEEKAIEKIKEYASCYGSDNLAYGWSGGKDSLVISRLCLKAGVKKGVFGTCDLEYPSFLNWVKQNIPYGVEPVSSGKDLMWLAKHQEMVFPDNNALKGKWYTITHRVSQKKYYDKRKLSGMILGRRKSDGNFTRNGESKDKDGRLWISPIFDWSHEDVFAYIHYQGLAVPPIYGWKDGYSQGTHLWPMRSSFGVNGKVDRMTVWKEVYEIDKSVVIEAARVISEAQKFLSEGL